MAIISSDRRIDWAPGIPGGIPSSRVVYQTMNAIDATGATDVSGDVQTAINAASALGKADPSHVIQEVVLPAGTFKFSSTVSLGAYSCLRGTLDDDGNCLTTVIAPNGSPLKIYEFQAHDEPIAISGSPAKGATSITVASVPATLQIGVCVQVQQENDMSYIAHGIEGFAQPWCMGQWVRVTNIVGNVLTIDPPLYTNYSAAQNPRIRFTFLNSGLLETPVRNFIVNAGIEDLIVENQYSSSPSTVEIGFADKCWLKNVNTVDCGASHVWLFDSFQTSIVDCSFTGALEPITSSRGYGIQMGTPNGSVPTSKTTALLIQNSIFDECRGNVLIGYGSSGVVVGYNFFVNTLDEQPTIQKPDVVFHSAFPIMCLVEGNIGTRMVSADNFHGNAGWNTIHRNWGRGKASDVKVSALISVEVAANHHNYNIVGNVLGYNGIVEDVAELADPAGESVRARYAPDDPTNFQNQFKALMFGYDGEGGGISFADTQVAATVIDHGNFDYVTNAQVWDEDIADHDIPDSYYLTEKPDWFGSLAWPPVNPAQPNMLNDESIPAGYRYVNGSDPGTLPAVEIEASLIVNRFTLGDV
jgi:hypothetical protein